MSILPALIKGMRIELADEPNPGMVHCLFTINRHIDQQHIISIVFLDPGFEGTGDHISGCSGHREYNFKFRGKGETNNLFQRKREKGIPLEVPQF